MLKGEKSTQKSIGEALEEALSKKPPLAANAPGIEKLSSEQTNGTLLRERDARRTKSEVRTRIAKQQKYRRTTPGRRKGITTRKQLLFDGRRCGRPGQISAREDRWSSCFRIYCSTWKKECPWYTSGKFSENYRFSAKGSGKGFPANGCLFYGAFFSLCYGALLNALNLLFLLPQNEKPPENYAKRVGFR